jgi:uncharacterized repeat protein (TIGR03803 family)
MEAGDGNFYGTTFEGGAWKSGTAFELTRSGLFKVIGQFDGSQGGLSVVCASDGNLYGLQSGGGAFSQGVLFRLGPKGGFMALHEFGSRNGRGSSGSRILQSIYRMLGLVGRSGDGKEPTGYLVESPDGYVYGVTGGGEPESFSGGTIWRYKIRP